MKKLKILSILVMLVLFVTNVKAQNDALPLNPKVRIGTLANGFTYYIQKNTEPANRVVMYLPIKAGSILEEDHQQGLAHFLEHMNFNGTTHFPKNELINYLQKAGVRFGADLNAYTSFDETVYQLPIASDDPEVLKNGLQIMRDWAHEALLETEEIDKERGVILEEKRTRTGAQQRMQEKFFPVITNNSQYARRLPIGTEEVLTTFKPQVIRDFYDDWYRPNLQALIVVGDIDVDAMEAQVKKLFSDLKNPANAKPRKEYKIPLTGKNQFLIVTDPEMPSTALQIMIKHPQLTIKTKADYKKALIRAMYGSMLGGRFNELIRQADPPFLGANSGMGGFIANLDAYSTMIQAKPGALESGVKAALTEVERVRRYGFTETELSRAKENYMASLNSQLQEKDKIKSESLVKEYLSHFLNGSASPGIEYEYELVSQLLPEVTVETIHNAAKEWMKETDRDILLMGPEKDKAILPGESTINEWIAAVKSSTIAPYEDKVSSKPLLDESTLPSPGEIVSKKTISSIGVTEMTLSNGIKVVLKPTDFKNDEIRTYAFSPGGTALYEKEKFFSASVANNVVSASGVGPYDAIGLQKSLAGKRVSAGPYISERSEGMRGFSTPKDAETMFQLIYQYFNAPNKNEEAFEGMIARYRASFENKGDDPNGVFKDTVSAVMGSHHYTRMPWEEEDLDKIKLDEAYEIYKDRFADAGDFTFVFVGNFTEENLSPLLKKYIATLPTSGRKEEGKDLGVRPPTGKISKTVKRGLEDKATVQMVYTGTYTYNPQNNIALKGLEEALNIKLTERLREAEGGVYTPGVQVSYGKEPENRYSIVVYFGCAPANVEKLIAATQDEIEKLKKAGPPAVDIQKFIAEEQKDHETNIKDNGYWMNYLVQQYLYNEDPEATLEFEETLKTLTPKMVKKAAKKYLNGKNYIRFVLLPEDK